MMEPYAIEELIERLLAPGLAKDHKLQREAADALRQMQETAELTVSEHAQTAKLLGRYVDKLCANIAAKDAEIAKLRAANRHRLAPGRSVEVIKP